MKKTISLFIVISLFICNVVLPVYANDTEKISEQTSINTIKGKTAVCNVSSDKSFDFNVDEVEGSYFVDFSILFADFNSISTINISGSKILSVNELGEISVLSAPTGITAKKNQWIDVSICADPHSENYIIDIDSTSMSGTNKSIKALNSMTMDINNVSSAGTQIYITAPKTGNIGDEDMCVKGSVTYIKSFIQTQGGEPSYIRDTIDDPTGYGKGKIQRLSLNGQKWMEGRSDAKLQDGKYEICAELYFEDFNATTNSLVARMNGTDWFTFCTFKHSTRDLVFGDRKGTKVICSGYEMNKWYKLGVIVDFDNSTYTVYLVNNDGECLGVDTSALDSSYKSLSQLSLYIADPGNSGAKTTTIYVHDFSYVESVNSGIAKIKPHRGETNCNTDGNIYIQSLNIVDSKSLEDAQISVQGNISMYSPDTIKISIGELEKNTQYDMTVSGIRDIFGNEISADISYTTGNGILYKNLTVDNGDNYSKVSIDYSGDLSSTDLRLYAATYNSENNAMILYETSDESEPEATVSTDENTIVQGYLWDSKMNIMTPSVGEKQNKYAGEQPCEITISKDYDTNIAVIKGTANNAASLILQDEDNNIIMIDEPRASENGFFKSEFFTDTIGTVKLLINTQDNNGIQEYSTQFYTREQINEIIEGFNDKDADIDTLIRKHAELFGIDLDEYNLVSKDIVTEIMKTKTYSEFSDVVNNYNYAMAVALFNAAQDGETASKLEKKYESIYGFDKTKTYSYYLEVSDKVKKRIFDNLAYRSNYANIEDVVSEFEKQVVLSAIECTEINSEVIPLLKTNNEYIGIDFTDFNRITETSNITSQIKGKKFEDIKELKDVFNKLVKQELNKADNRGNSGNSGSSGGGKFGGGITVSDNKVELPVSKDVIEDLKNDSVVFTDIKEVPWAEECIIYLYNKKIVNGKEDNRFKPNDNITRAEFVKLISLAFPRTTDSKTNKFLDVDENEWYAPYIKNAYNNGWVNGKSNNTFGVNDSITREDMAVILYRVANSLVIPIEKEKSVLFYDDDEISGYAKDAVNVLAEGNIISGVGNNVFLPKNTATRAEAVKLIYCLMKKAENEF